MPLIWKVWQYRICHFCIRDDPMPIMHSDQFYQAIEELRNDPVDVSCSNFVWCQNSLEWDGGWIEMKSWAIWKWNETPPKQLGLDSNCQQMVTIWNGRRSIFVRIHFLEIFTASVAAQTIPMGWRCFWPYRRFFTWIRANIKRWLWYGRRFWWRIYWFVILRFVIFASQSASYKTLQKLGLFVHTKNVTHFRHGSFNLRKFLLFCNIEWYFFA